MSSVPRSRLYLTWLPAAACLLSALGTHAAPARFQKVPASQQLQPQAPSSNNDVEFRGATAFTPEQLRVPLADPLNEIQQHGLTRPRADDTAYFLSLYYRKQGFPDADVQWDISGQRLILKIKEGPRTYLGKITYEGNKTQPANELNEYMVGETSEKADKKPARGRAVCRSRYPDGRLPPPRSVRVRRSPRCGDQRRGDHLLRGSYPRRRSG